MRKLPFLLMSLLLALPALAELTRFWQQGNYSEFEKGTAAGVSLRSDGEILLAPRFQPLADPNLEFLWTVVEDKEGNLYVGGGSPARVVKIDTAGQVTTLLETKELEVHALVVDPRNQTLYAATSPDGSVYRIPRSGSPELFFDPKTKYLWDLVQDSKGEFYLATGDKGEVFRIRPDGSGRVIFRSDETHIRTLSLGPDGHLYAGTDPNGLVLRISPDGKGFVLYEMPRKEITSLRFDAAGNLYVGGIGVKAPAPSFPIRPVTPTLPAQPQPSPSDASVTITVTPTGTIPTPTIPTQRLPLLAAGGSDVYRIAPDGYPEALWSSPTDLVYALTLDSTGRPLVGTGNEGRVLALDSATLFTHLVKASSEQVTVLVRSRRGPVLVATANPGKVFALGPQLESEGHFESDVFDAALFSHWGRINWKSRTPNGPGSVRLFTRSGNTSDPRQNWSEWREVTADGGGAPIQSPPARFIQWKAVLRAVDSTTPSLSGVSLAYLRRNAPPSVENIIVQAPGVRVRGLPTAPQQEPAKLELPPPPKRQTGGVTLAQAQAQATSSPQRIEPPPQGVTEPGVRSVVWSADDANEDSLVFSLYYRGEEETRWKLMKDNLTEKFYSWDAATLPDGAYTVKVVASDAPSNPADLALTGENVSDRFEVDNTPPRIEHLTAQTRSQTVEVSFTAEDSFSPLKRAEYSVDAGEWKPIFPLSRTTDARQHSYVFRLEKLGPDEHTVVVRVYDRFDNPSLAKVTFTIK